jgi:hypothetical protein
MIYYQVLTSIQTHVVNIKRMAQRRAYLPHAMLRS